LLVFFCWNLLAKLKIKTAIFHTHSRDLWMNDLYVFVLCPLLSFITLTWAKSLISTIKI
jgi:hypothetical protein